MSRRIQLLWISLLVSHLAGPVGPRTSGALGGPQMVRAGESIDSAHMLSIARSVPALQAGPQSHRHVGPSLAAIPGNLQQHAFEQGLLAPAVLSRGDALARTERHYPLFPTGPPAHS